MLRTSLVFLTGIVAAVIGASSAAAAAPSGGGPAALQPVPSLTPAATQRLWRELVRRPRVHSLGTAACSPLRAVFYSPTDWRRLATRLAANASSCAQYYISVPPLVSDKSQLRADEAWRIRALGPAFHALAEINVTGWTSWVATTGNSWYAAGVEARRRMAAAGYDVAAGDTWALNELSSAVRQGTGNARANMRAFLRGLYDAGGELPAAQGVVFVIGIAQTTGDLSVYQARLQDWYEDAGFWSDVSRYASDWSQELYGDIRTYAVAGVPRETRRDSLNEYLQHASTLAGVAPAGTEAARAFLAGAYSPLANAAWQYDAAFGWTNVPVALMQDYVSAQTYATRSAGNSRFGFAWSPRNPGIPAAEFNAQTDALLVRLAKAIADSGDTPEAACATTLCTGTLDGAVATTAWRTFAAWKPSVLAFTSAPQTLSPGTPSAPVTVEIRTHAGTPYFAGVPVPVELRSSSSTAEFSLGQGGPWTTTLTTSIGSGQGATTFFVRDTSAGTADIVAGSPGKTAATQALTVADTTPPETRIDSAPTGTVTTTNASISFSANEPGARFECSLDSAAFAACTTPAAYIGLAAGAHTFDVRAIDAAGNADASPARASWTVTPPAPPPPDTTPPETRIDSAPTGTVTTTNASISFSANEPGARFECSLDSAAFAACTTPAAYIGLAAGAHTFDVRAIDAAGNADASPARASWTVAPPPDTTPPETRIDSAPTGTAATTNATISFAASEPGARFECALDGASFAACTSPASYGGLGDGAHTFDVRAIDAAGNVDSSPARASWVVEPPPPPVTAPVAPAPSPTPSGGGTTPIIVTPVSAPAPVAPQPSRVAPFGFRALTASPVRVARSGDTATISVRFWVSARARLRAVVTPIRSTRALALRRGTVLAGTRLAGTRMAATATVARAGAYLLRARLASTRLVRGRLYLVRFTATDASGGRRLLNIRVRG